ncbi:LytTR family transcriptional regulator DNA-binding domain-containing protein [Paenibacillus tianjinensis]|uniref:LytTR family transcriptional regulator DNA-binding domain-containing protein n=1 Tax=Paenibacillus tianjinensis TaxID=2810347 RepID=A0ABX7L601_9BACL|nr:LytTR family transcriptional regulator DNA-binding domain-containing protein [Paenibacillus tianjinensis]QSF42708.1 LytTR family transcriptional regulator DNA-binding domain-containing protein [Paenibacillus tianjinensis]
MIRRMKRLQGDKKDKFECRDVDLKDVNYIDKWQRTGNSHSTLAYHTSEGSYQDLDILAEAAEAYKDQGFILIGRTALVQESKIEIIISVENNGSIITFKDGTKLYVMKQI